jgi:hypothetical protein
MLAPGATQPPIARAQVADDVAVQFGGPSVVQLGFLDELHAHVVDDAVLELDAAS